MEGQADTIAGGKPIKLRKARQDESIMATNNSSIVSKRSVERLYHPEPHFFRYFVRKPQRRSPLINRGYWLRMYAVECIVREFLNEYSEKKKLVLNLGCGYDPLAFQLLSKSAKECQDVKFVDIDYPELISRKIKIISQTPQIVDLLGLSSDEKYENLDPAILRSEHYMALGCDLADIKKLDTFLVNELDLETCSLLFIAEVSMTYMDVAAADSLIKWACLCDDSRFCLLEQILPNGPLYPFARKMIQHFDNLKTSLQSIHQYPDLESQEHRFLDAGWLLTNARSLWDLWNDGSFINSSQRAVLSEVEPFDEWEEFALFASHYFLLVATKTSTVNGNYFSGAALKDIDNFDLTTLNAISENPHISYYDFSRELGGCRRFGASVLILENVLIHHGGFGTQRRLNSTQVYKSNDKANINLPLPPLAIEPRMCHTMTRLDGNRCLLVGGRTSPDRALSDCWLYKDKTWKRVEDLPIPLYRHCATVVSLGIMNENVLIYGGKSGGGKVVNDWLLWHDSTGWVKLAVRGAMIQPRFGAAMSFTGPRHGILLGGMADDCTVVSEIWKWSISNIDANPSVILSKNYMINGLGIDHLAIACRVGACFTWSSIGLLLIGGIAKQLLSQNLDIICLSPKYLMSRYDEMTIFEACPIKNSLKDQAFLLVGHSASSFGESVIIVGGGSVCFSFGTFWNQGILALQDDKCKKPHTWILGANIDLICDSARPENNTDVALQAANLFAQNGKVKGEIAKFIVQTSEHFERLMNNSNPFMMEHMDLGTCLAEWNLDFLKAKVGAERSIVVHEATEEHMDFTQKNFHYVKKPFGQFIDEIGGGSRQYLRSLAAEKPSVKPADFACDFPELAPDFQIPPQLSKVTQNMHSSPLRISGPVIMWLHYDVMANVLCQIRGSKQIILYPPSDVSHLELTPGESSSSINVFDKDAPTRYPSLKHAHPQEAILKPGDILYIPPAWFHTALPRENYSISINIFFRNLQIGYAAGRDVYGNRDLQAYEYGRREVGKIFKAFEALPPQLAKFYLERLTGELNQKARQYRSE